MCVFVGRHGILYTSCSPYTHTEEERAWAVPPLDPAIRDGVEDWAKPKLATRPTWAKIVAGSAPVSGSSGEMETQ